MSISKTIADTLRAAKESRRGCPRRKAPATSPLWPGAAKDATSAAKPSPSKKNGSLRVPAKNLSPEDSNTVSMGPDTVPAPGTFSSCRPHSPRPLRPKRAWTWTSATLSKLPPTSRSMWKV